jgi:hypothetical protein
MMSRIHNSINASIHEDEVLAVKESDLTSAIVLAFNATEGGVRGKIEILEEGAAGIDKGMLEIAADCGITKPLIDIAAMPLGAGAGANVRAGVAVKARLGLPVGAGYHNSASAWDWMKTYKKENRDVWAPYHGCRERRGSRAHGTGSEPPDQEADLIPGENPPACAAGALFFYFLTLTRKQGGFVRRHELSLTTFTRYPPPTRLKINRTLPAGAA